VLLFEDRTAPTRRFGFGFEGSVNVRLRQLESIPRQLAPRITVALRKNLDNIEAKKDVRIVQETKLGKAPT
jgi:hypothetical protein